MSDRPARVAWVEANQRLLAAAVAVIRERLLMGAGRGREEALQAAIDEEKAAETAMPAPSALALLVEALALTPFERGVVLLAAARDLDARFQAVLDGLGWPAPTFGLAMAALPDGHWDAMAPGAPLRGYQIIHLQTGVSVVRAPLELDERVLNYLTGVAHLDARLDGMVTPLPTRPLVPSQERLAERVATAWRARERPVVQLSGVDAASRHAVASRAAALLGMSAALIWASDLPESPSDRASLLRIWAREAALSRAVLVIGVEAEDPPPVVRRAAAYAEALEGPVLLSLREPAPLRDRVSVRLEVGRPDHHEQRALWRESLGARAADLSDGVDRLVAHFDLGPERITASVVAAGPLPEEPASALPQLWAATRLQSRPDLEGLAARIDARAGWDDLVLPEPQRRVMEEMLAHTRRRQEVSRDWGFAGRSARGLGLSALFEGQSGTGKTLAAEVLAGALSVDLYRIDLSAVMSKYIGETEKNLRRIFDAAEGCGAILLFDEADALFGRRSEVKDSHDRYANIEVSYLLQRMEAYAGLAVLTTNLKENLDPAFLRRIRFVVHFPFPDREQRREIWRRTIPSQAPSEGLDYARLAQLNVAGGNIRNIAYNAAVLAADEQSPLRMSHLLRAARTEYAKLEQPLTSAETGGWR